MLYASFDGKTLRIVFAILSSEGAEMTYVGERYNDGK